MRAHARTALAAGVSLLLGVFLFVFPVQSASAEGSGLCSICNPTGVELEAELAGGGGAGDGAGTLSAADRATSDQLLAQLNDPTAPSGVSGDLAGGPLTAAADVATSDAAGGAAGWSWKTLGLGLLGFGLTGTAGMVLDGSGGGYAGLPTPGGSGTVSGYPLYGVTAAPLGISVTSSSGSYATAVSVTYPGGWVQDNQYVYCTPFASAAMSAANMAFDRSSSYGSAYGGSYYADPAPTSGVADCSAHPGTKLDGVFEFGHVGSTYYAGTYETPAPSGGTTPVRWVEQTITCTASDGSTVTSTIDGPPSDFSSPVPIAGLTCPDGSTASAWSAKVKTSGAPDVDLGTVTNPASDSAHDLAGCAAIGVVCQLKLQYRTSTTSSTWLDCEVGKTGPCTQWARDPDKLKNYRCEYGTDAAGWHLVTLASCSTLSSAYQPNPTRTPYDPGAGQPTPSGSCEIGWGDLLTGQVVEKAVGCALSWAFVPDATTLQETQAQLSDSFDSSVLGQAKTTLTNAVGPLTTAPSGSAGDCHGPSVSLTWVNDAFTTPVHPLDVCDGLPKKIHDWALPLVLIFLWGAALMSSWFFIAQAFDLGQES